MTKEFKWTDIGADEYVRFEDDPDIKKYMEKEQIEKQAGFTYDISRLLQKTPYSGSSTIQEMLELEMNMRDLISENKFGYKMIESYLISLGYNLNKIRRVFKKITGVDPNIYLDNQPYLHTPASIPQINYGWGEAKSKDFDYFFIMPWNNDYCIFGQKGDLEREIVSKHFDLETARKELSSKVKTVYQYDKVLSENDLIKDKRIFTPEDLPLGIKSSMEEDSDLSLKSLQTSEDFSNQTPSDFLDEIEKDDSFIIDAVKTIHDYIQSVSEKVSSYIINLKGFKYISQEGGSIEITPEVEGINIKPSTFDVPAVFSVIVEMKQNDIIKKGLLIFLYKDGELTTNGVFKGEDKKLYAFSEEGINSYFTK